jgi:hypothetical protein
MTSLCQNLEIGQRWAYWLREIYQHDAAKLIARDFDVSISTSTRWLGGTVPTVEYLTIAAKRWGWPFITFLYGKLPIPTEIELEARLLEAEKAAEKALQTIKDLKNEGLGSTGRGGVGNAVDRVGTTAAGLGSRPILRAS